MSKTDVNIASSMVPNTALGDKLLGVWIRTAEERYGPPPPPIPPGLVPYRASGFTRCAVHSKNHRGVEYLAGHPHLELHARCTCVGAQIRGI